MDSNTIGEIAKKTIELDLLKKGFRVSRVYGAMNKYDLLIRRIGRWKRVKIKTVQRWGDGPTQWSVRKIDIREVDIYATIDKVLDKNPIIKYTRITEWDRKVSGADRLNKEKNEPSDIWCGDCEHLYIDINIQKEPSFRCRYPGFDERYGEGGRYLSEGTPPKSALEWCPKRSEYAKEEKGL